MTLLLHLVKTYVKLFYLMLIFLVLQESDSETVSDGDKSWYFD